MQCCKGGSCYNYPMHDFFDCQNKGGAVNKARSVDSGIMACKNACYDQIGKLSRQDFKDCLGNCGGARSMDSEKAGRKAGLWEECEQDSDCQSGSCSRWDECVPSARGVEETAQLASLVERLEQAL